MIAHLDLESYSYGGYIDIYSPENLDWWMYGRAVEVRP